VQHRNRRLALAAGIGEPVVCGREGEEQIARVVAADLAGPGDADRGALREALALVGQKRRIGGQDHDDRPGTLLGRLGRGRDRDLFGPDHPADPHSVDREALAPAVVRLHQRPDGVAPVVLADAPGRAADPALEAVADHPGAAADRTLRYRAGRGVAQRLRDVVGSDVLAVDVVEHPVPGLPDDRNAPELLALVGPAVHIGQRIADDPDAVGVGDPDRGREHPRLANPVDARELAVAVETVGPGEHRRGPDPAVGEDHRHPGADRAAADAQRTRSADERRVPDHDAVDIGDRVERSRRQVAHGEADLPCDVHPRPPARSIRRSGRR